MNSFIVFCIFVVATECVKNNSAITPRYCDFTKLAEGKKVSSICRTFRHKRVCTVHCPNEFETPPADEYKCISTSDHPEGIWTPDVVPLCIRKEGDKSQLCDIRQFVKDNHDIGWDCMPHNFTDMTCKLYCKHTGAYLIPSEYKCKVTPGIRGGKWIPELIPSCERDLEACDIGIFDKYTYNIGWICTQYISSEMSCKPFCQLKDEYMTQQVEYKCKVTPGIRGGKWLPEVLPNCQRDCDFRKLTKQKHVKWSCSRRGFRNQKFCKISCEGTFQSSPAQEYKCIATPNNPDGIWKPRIVPRCIPPEDCNVVNLTRNKNISFNCSRKGLKNQNFCTVSCKGKFETPPADEYSCISTPDNPAGRWTPEAVPRCLRKDCDFLDLAQDKNVHWSCSNRGFSNETFCTVSCKGKFETPPAEEYHCSSAPDIPGGIWKPDVVPRCIPKVCNFHELTKGKHVSWSCQHRGFRYQKFCTVSCTGKFETPPADEYHCTTTPDSDVIWTPNTVPHCLAPKDCNFYKLLEGKNVDSICSRRGSRNENVCTVSCKNEFETPPAAEYRCFATPENPEGIWTPDVVPRCIRKGCDFREMMQGKDIGYNCSRRDCMYQNFCTVSCVGKFVTPPADVYTCIITPENPKGIWTPDAVPRCVPINCDFFELARGKDVGFECGRKGFYDKNFCTVSCDGEFETPPEDEYKCVVTPENPDGIWTVYDVPRCILREETTIRPVLKTRVNHSTTKKVNISLLTSKKPPLQTMIPNMHVGRSEEPLEEMKNRKMKSTITSI